MTTRERWIDRAIDENDEEITSSSGFDEAVAVVAGYCEEHAGFDDITGVEFAAGFDRKTARIHGELTSAEADQEAAGMGDLKRLLEIAGKAAFETAGMTIEGILDEMDRRGELSDADKREAAGVEERMPTINVPPEAHSEET